MSDGREERKEQEERRKWEEQRKEPRREPDDRERTWERDGRPERRDSRASGMAHQFGYISRPNMVTNRLSASS
jgi:hypothetical protein